MISIYRLQGTDNQRRLSFLSWFGLFQKLMICMQNTFELSQKRACGLSGKLNSVLLNSMLLKFVINTLLWKLVIMTDCMPNEFSWRTPEKDVLQFLTTAIQGKSVNFTTECITQLLERNYYESALRLYEDYFQVNEIDIDDDQISKTLQASRKSQDNFFNIHNKHVKQAQVWEPVFQWVQSNNSVLFQVKFSHRIDAPSCLNTKIEDVTITKNSVFLQAKGVISHQPITFLLNLTLFDDINVNRSKWNSESVGTLVFDLRKQGPGLWKRLTEEQRKINIWWEMRSHFRRDMDDYFIMIEEDAEGKKKAKKGSKKKEKEPIVVDL